MKILHCANCCFYILTIIPYITIYFVMYGMYAQFLLGVIQLILALILLFSLKKFNLDIRKHMKRYWMSVLGILSFIWVISKSSGIKDDVIQVLFVFVIPMIIASYFVYITYLIQKQ